MKEALDMFFVSRQGTTPVVNDVSSNRKEVDDAVQNGEISSKVHPGAAKQCLAFVCVLSNLKGRKLYAILV